jgi:outer membrane protein OmpA-like peptidoglycan-associated protein
LGVSPDYLDANKDEGAIIEFSVMEPQAGLLSWKFQLRGPGKKAGDDMVTVQEVKGAGPVFHQIYWNGRNKYFGDILPGGRYECVLTATDSKNKSRKRHLWINVKGKPVEKAVTQTIAKAEPPPATLEPDPAPVQRKVRGKTIESEKAAKARRARRRKERRMRRRAAQKESSVKKGKTLISTPKEESSANAEDAASRPARAGAVNYQVVFVKNAAGITPDGENILNRVADTMHYYPLDNINLVGYAYSGEQDSDSLASRRADAVSRHLVQKHGMKRDRIQVQTKIMDSESHKVEIYIVSGGS